MTGLPSCIQGAVTMAHIVPPKVRPSSASGLDVFAYSQGAKWLFPEHFGTISRPFWDHFETILKN